MTITAGLTFAGLSRDGDTAPGTTSAAPESGDGAASSDSAVLNSPPGAPLDRDTGEDTGPSQTAALRTPSPVEDEEPDPAQPPSATTANSGDAAPTATTRPESTAAPPSAASPAPSPTPPPTQPLSPPTAMPVPPTATPVPPTATPTSPPPQSISLHAMEAAMLEAHNLQRANSGAAPLAMDAQLVNLARQRSQTMANSNCFSHTACGSTAFDLIGGIGYAYQVAGENIARNNYPDSDTVTVSMNGFMNSQSHRANILETRYDRVGIGVAFGANGMKYFTVIFAGP